MKACFCLLYVCVYFLFNCILSHCFSAINYRPLLLLLLSVHRRPLPSGDPHSCRRRRRRTHRALERRPRSNPTNVRLQMLVRVQRNLPWEEHGNVRQIRPDRHVTHAESLPLQVGFGGELLVEDSEQLVHHASVPLLLHEDTGA